MPKKKGAKKGAKIIDGVATSEMSREQLLGHVRRMQQELEREREERNFFMLEREKLFSLWNLSLEQLRKEKNTSKLAQFKLNEKEKDLEEEMQIYKQKLRYFLTEQSRAVNRIRLDNLKKMKHVQDDMWAVQSSVRETVEQKNNEIGKAQQALQCLVRNTSLEKIRETSKLREDCSHTIRRMEMKFKELLYQKEKEDLLAQNELLIHSEMKRSEDMKLLTEVHEREMKDLRNFYNEITVNNHAVIATLKDEITEMKKSNENIQKKLEKAHKDYKRLEKDFNQLMKVKEQQSEELKKHSTAMQRHWQNLDKKLQKSAEKNKKLSLANETLFQKILLVQNERDELKKYFTQMIANMQKKSNMERMLLEYKLTILRNQENTSAQLPAENVAQQESGEETTSQLSQHTPGPQGDGNTIAT